MASTGTVTYRRVLSEYAAPDIILPVLRRVDERVGLHSGNIAVAGGRRVADQTLEVNSPAQRRSGVAIGSVRRLVLDPL